MFNGSHSRQSHPFDKRVPKMDSSWYNSAGRQVKKKMHTKKQRQHNKELINQEN